MNWRAKIFLKYIFLTIFITVIGAVYAGAQSKIPDGSYKESCRDFHVVGGNLTANCENEKGQWIFSKIYIDSCAGDIWNEDGNLKCKQRPAPPAPSGSYKNSCKDIEVKGDRLKAKCEKKNGNWNNTSINYKKCDRDIWNDNGELTCKKKQSSKLPSGSYKNSCRDAYTEGKRLYAECQRRDGSWKKSSINYKNCNKNISNDNGNLICGSSDNNGKIPPGSYKKTCRNIYKDGNVLEAECKDKNGNWRNTSIKFKQCKDGLKNDNGRLRCN